MNVQEHVLKLTVYDEISQLTHGEQQLIHAANMALNTSYSPYSNFKVGAAAILKMGRRLVVAIRKILALV